MLRTSRQHARLAIAACGVVEMDLEIEANERLVLRDAADFKAFRLVVRPEPGSPGDDALRRVLAATDSRLEGRHAWISEAWLRAQRRDDAQWQQQLTDMLTFAASRGWVDQRTGTIRAHIEKH